MEITDNILRQKNLNMSSIMLDNIAICYFSMNDLSKWEEYQCKKIDLLIENVFDYNELDKHIKDSNWFDDYDYIYKME